MRWDKKEIKDTAKILHEAEKNKSPILKLLEEVAHWLIILIVFLGNLLIDAFIVVISPLLRTGYLYVFVILLGFGFGLMIATPLREIEKIHPDKLFFSKIMLPLLTLVNVYLLVGIKNTVEFFTEIYFGFDAIFIGIVYGAFFLIPLILTRKVKKTGLK